MMLSHLQPTNDIIVSLRLVVKWYPQPFSKGWVQRSNPASRERLWSKLNMYYVYLLKDKKDKYYIGYSSDLRKRLREHLRKEVFTTKKMEEPKLFYYEAYSDEYAARSREQKLKQFGSSFAGLIKRLKLGS